MQTMINHSKLSGEGLCGPLSARLISEETAGAWTLGKRNILFPSQPFSAAVTFKDETFKNSLFL